MKLTSATIGTLIFTALATAAFVWMAKRPAVDATAMKFGMPAQDSGSSAPATPKPVIEAPAVSTTEASTSPNTSSTPTTNETIEEKETPKVEEAAPAPTIETTTTAPVVENVESIETTIPQVETAPVSPPVTSADDAKAITPSTNMNEIKTEIKTAPKTIWPETIKKAPQVEKNVTTGAAGTSAGSSQKPSMTEATTTPSARDDLSSEVKKFLSNMSTPSQTTPPATTIPTD